MAPVAAPLPTPTNVCAGRNTDVEPKAHHVLIGLFTVVTIAAILMFALWLGDPEATGTTPGTKSAFARASAGCLKAALCSTAALRLVTYPN